MDIWLMVLPIQIVMGLTMGWLAKLGLMAMFSMGFLIVGPAFAVFIAFIVSPDQYGVNILCMRPLPPAYSRSLMLW